jgi:endonuclease/exonuclease/phosphatase family metal-dependent hydrolase
MADGREWNPHRPPILKGFMKNNDPIVNVASYNIRYDNAGDGVNAWPNRREWVRELLDYHEFDVVGIQEALVHQLEFLVEERFDYVGVGRDDGKKAGEFSAILFDKNRFEKKDSGTFWLSETPDVPSKSWDSSLPRVCTWVRLRNRAAKNEFYHFNTHFDHKGIVAREKAADIILQKITAIAGKNTFFLTGDFNLTPDTVPIRRLAAALKNARGAAITKPYGPEGTFNGFDIQRPLGAPIDHIFISPQVKVLRYAVIPDNWGLRYPSDHLPVAIKAEF